MLQSFFAYIYFQITKNNGEMNAETAANLLTGQCFFPF